MIAERASRVCLDSDSGCGRGVIAPVIDPADYDNDTDYLNAIPGMAESIVELMNAPASEFSPVSRKFFNVY